MDTRILMVVDYVPHVDIMEEFLKNAGFEVKVTEDRNMLLPGSISQFHVFLDYTHGNLLNAEQTKSVIDFVANGKALVGIHSAAVDKQSPDYISLLGGKYIGHRDCGNAIVTVSDENHPITKDIKFFAIIDEVYKLDYDPKPLHILIEGEVEGKMYPVCWVKEHGKGKVAFLSLGHGKEAFENIVFQELVIRCIKWATGQI
ncbi:ThuA domain-containing protein [Candidatus Poribacteria bacterium]|nr:ThuA domain-containing protein [Candidatus Poribacteria bacterium]